MQVTFHTQEVYYGMMTITKLFWIEHKRDPIHKSSIDNSLRRNLLEQMKGLPPPPPPPSAGKGNEGSIDPTPSMTSARSDGRSPTAWYQGRNDLEGATATQVDGFRVFTDQQELARIRIWENDSVDRIGIRLLPCYPNEWPHASLDIEDVLDMVLGILDEVEIGVQESNQ